MTAKFMPEPSARICPKCKNSTLIFMSFRRIWQCSHVEGDRICGFSESYDSISAILRGIVMYLEKISLTEEDTGVAIELSKIKDKADEILRTKDQITILGAELP